MKKLIAVILLSLSIGGAGAADIFVADSIGYKMTLTDELCRVPHIAADIPPQLKNKIFHGRVEFKDEARGSRELCYADAGNGNYFIEDDAGSEGFVPKDAFNRMVGA